MVLVAGLGLLGGCLSTADEPDQETETVLSTIALHNHYEKDFSDVPRRERDDIDTGLSIGVIVERDGELIQWSEHHLESGQDWSVQSDWPATAGNWTVHARQLDPEHHRVQTEWRTIDLEDFVQSDEVKDVAVDVIVTETGRIDLDATPET